MGLWLRLAAAVLHTAAGLGLYAVSWRCGAQRFQQQATVYQVLPWQDWQARGSPGAVGPAQCNSSAQCFRYAEPWAEDQPLAGSYWNPFVLAMAFEWLSAGFALFYLREDFGPAMRRVAAGWNALALLLAIVWFAVKRQGDWAEALVVSAALVAGGALFLLWDGWLEQLLRPFRREGLLYDTAPVGGRIFRVPRVGARPETDAPDRLLRRLAVLPRYAEYTVSASLLYLAVLQFLAVGPPAWALIAGAAGVFACNAFGVPLHVMQTELEEGRSLLPPSTGQHPAAEYNTRMSGDLLEGAQTALSLLGLGKWRVHWVARNYYLQAAWIGLGGALMIVLYIGGGVMFNPALPPFVLFLIWNLLVLYCSFGVVSTAFYARDAWWPWHASALDALSVAAKVPVAVTIACSFVLYPGGGCSP